MMSNIQMVSSPGEILIADSIIQKLKSKNNLDFDLTINIDYLLDTIGMYTPEIPNTIFVNPDLVMIDNDAESKKYHSYSGYVYDNTLIAVVLHEFSHFLCHEVFVGIVDDYDKKFSKVLALCDNSYKNKDEELVEIMRLYIINPLLLKLIDGDVYKFIKSYFKSPSPTSQKHAIEFYDDYPVRIRKELAKKWKLKLLDNKITKVE
tara:strand:- start:4019 stop:4633 length:615 start_codon:yes stop_codon:yes gene_type:complete